MARYETRSVVVRYPWNRLLYPLGERPPYRDPKGWVSAGPAVATPAPLEGYEDVPVVVLLGERGVGKSDVLSSERLRLTADSGCRFIDLPYLGTAAAATLAGAMKPGDADSPHHLLLDTLDEALDTVPHVWQDIAASIGDLGAEHRRQLRLRIVCRSSRWPSRFQDALEQLWPAESGQWPPILLLGLAGLTRSDVLAAAELNGLGEPFVRELEARQLVVPLASWPVTLNPVLRAAVEGKPLPQDAAQAYEQACGQLCTETDRGRRDTISSAHPSRMDLLAAGSRVAAALQFGNADALARDPDEPGLSVSAVAGGDEPDGTGHRVDCTEHLLLKLTETALMTPLAARRYGFSHHSFQEFLAARYLQVHRTPAQVRWEMLIIGNGRSRHVVDSQREVAAWLAVSDHTLFDEVLSCDPQVLLLADLAALSEADRSRVTAALLKLVSDDYTIHLDTLLLYRLDHPGLASQLAPLLGLGQPANELYAALHIARACPTVALTGRLLTLAEDPQAPEPVRAMAIEAIDPGSRQGAASRILELARSPLPDLAGAALAWLWPAHLATPDMLALLPRPHPDKLASGWGFLRTLPQHLEPADLADALAWAGTAASGSSCHDHTVLAIRILAWAARAVHQSDASAAAAAPRLAEVLLLLARSEAINERGLPLDEVRDALAADSIARRAVARGLLSDPGTTEDLAYARAAQLGLFPRADAVYWAGQLPAFPAEFHDRFRIPLREAPEDEAERERAWELADGSPLIRAHTQRWWSLPADHPLAADARYQRAADQRLQAARAARRYDATTMNSLLAALISGVVPARQGWWEVVAYLHRTPEGDPFSISTRLDLRVAPRFPPDGSPLHELLLTAAALTVGEAPLITAADTDPVATGLPDVPELWALSLLAEAGRPEPGQLDAPRWAGLTRALACVYASPEDQDLLAGLISAGVRHAQSRVGEQLPGMLDSATTERLAVIMSRLAPGLTPVLADRIRDWSQAPQRSAEAREITEDALARHGDQVTLDDLRHVVTTVGGHQSLNLGSAAVQRWISSATTLARWDAAASWAAIAATIATMPDMARPFLDRLAERSTLEAWPMDLSALDPGQIAGMYDLIVTHGPPSLPLHSGAVVYGPGQKLYRFRSQIPRFLAGQLTPEAGDELAALSARYGDHWQLRELARQHAREIAAQAWQPVDLEQLLAVAGGDELRLVRDERQLSDVVIESLQRLQDLLSAPNGWATLLWHRTDFKASTGWWPAWEEDLSDLVAGFLRQDLAARQVIVNREVQIVRPGLDGQRTDIHVQASQPENAPRQQPLTVIIECKGCWNADLAAGLSAQLVDKYLTRPGRNAGIYLIGYFHSPRWTRDDPRRHPKHLMSRLRAEQERTAASESEQKVVCVAAFILDCQLPGVSRKQHRR